MCWQWINQVLSVQLVWSVDNFLLAAVRDVFQEAVFTELSGTLLRKPRRRAFHICSCSRFEGVQDLTSSYWDKLARWNETQCWAVCHKPNVDNNGANIETPLSEEFRMWPCPETTGAQPGSATFKKKGVFVAKHGLQSYAKLASLILKPSFSISLCWQGINRAASTLTVVLNVISCAVVDTEHWQKPAVRDWKSGASKNNTARTRCGIIRLRQWFTCHKHTMFVFTFSSISWAVFSFYLISLILLSYKCFPVSTDS